MAEGAAEAPSASSIVEDWLRSVDLVQYTQAFLDNGYDDLEVCKQIGEDDLEAIGVLKDEHKERLLRAVRVLKEEGGTAVYFTLEECDTCQSGDETEVGESTEDDRSVVHSSSSRMLATPVNSGGTNGRHVPPHTSHGQPGMQSAHGYSRRKPLTTFSSVQLKLILRDKLALDNIDLSNPPYTNMDQCMCGSSVTALALRFSQELNTHFAHVLEQLEDLWIMANNEASINYPDMCRSPSRGMYTRSHSVQYDPHLHAAYRLQPPPLPTCPPPATMSGSHVSRCTSLQAHLDKGHVRPDPMAQPNYVALDGGVCCLFPRKIITDPSSGPEEKKKGGSVFGRFLRNFGLRRSARKAAYKQHHGDPNAYEMSMSEEDRMALMLLVKEGKISTQTALAVVQKYEEEKRLTGGASGIGALALEVSGKENVTETPSKKLGLGKKKKGSKPPKSQSSLSADDPHQGGLQSPTTDISSPQGSCDHLVCRRVHSLSQLDSGHHPSSQLDLHHDPHRDKLLLTRAVSCSPACTPSHKQMGHGENSIMSRLQSPSHHHFPHVPHVHLHSHAQPNLFQHSYQPHPQQLQQQHHQQLQHHQQQQQQQLQHHIGHSQQHMNKMDSLRERLSVRATNIMPKTSSKTSLLSSGSDQSMDCLSHPPLRTDPLTRRGCNDANTYNSNSTVSMSSENSPALSRKKNGVLPDPKLKNARSASCSTGDDGISSENDDPEQRSRSRLKQDIAKGKSNHEHRRHQHQVKEAHIYRPPLLRQQSAPGSGVATERYLGQAKAVVDFTPGPDQDGFVPLKKGEIVNILNMAQSGVWRGVVNGKQGKFRFEHVEVIIDPDAQLSPLGPHGSGAGGLKDLRSGSKEMPRSVADMLTKIGLESLTNLFMTNGYDDLDIFSELDDNDLDTLHISDPNQRTKLLSAAKVLAEWNEKIRSHTPSITAVDSPSSRAGNSSCDSGCYAGGEGGNKHKHKSDGKKGERGKSGQNPCTSCGKPKQTLKSSSSSNMAPPLPAGPPPSSYPTTPSAYPQVPPSAYSPYAPGHHGIPYMTSSSHYNTAGYPWDAHDPYHGSMSNSRTLTDMNVSENSATPSQPPMLMMYPGGSSIYRDRYPTGDGQSLTEEDQEVIAITYGTHRRRKLSTPAQAVSASSSHSEIAGSMGGTYTPSYYYRQYDGVSLCSDPSCPQCVAYMSCPQCATYHHYVNTTIRSDSKSSKMSYSSTCTQTTCLSPDQDENYSSCHSDCPTSPSRLIANPQQGYPPQSSHQHMYPLSPSYSQTAPATPNKFALTPMSPEGAAQPFSTHQPPTSIDNSKQQLQQSKGTNSPAQAKTSSSGDHTSQATSGALSRSDVDAGSKVPTSIWPHNPEGTESPSIASLYSRDGGSNSPSKSESGASASMKSPMRSLMPLVSTKLSAERINLGQSPYSTETGECCIPPLLVQRYAEELRQDLKTISQVLEQIRARHLQEVNKPYIKYDNLSDACSTAVELQISSVPAFLTSIGLPMYESVLTEAKMTTVEQLMQLKATELEKVTGADSRHLQRISHALEWVQSKLSSPTNRGKTTGPVDKV